MADSPSHPGGDKFVISRRGLLIGGGLAAASGIAFIRQPEPVHPVIDEDEFTSWIPKQIGPWRMDATSSVVLPPKDALSDRLYDNLVTRTYVSREQPAIMLLLAYNNIQDGMLQVHRPETCYPVGGFALSNSRQEDIVIGGKPVPATFFTAAGPRRTEQVGYFTRIGSSFPISWGDQRLIVARANLAREIPDAMMMRVSLLGNKHHEAQAILADFCARFFQKSDARLQRLLLGPYA
jgi:EpsI family protein